MDTLRDIVSYLCLTYPHKSELSLARLTKMVYLADWKTAINQERQLTNIAWYFNHYGPYVDDVENIIVADNEFNIRNTTTPYGTKKNLVEAKATASYEISDNVKTVLDEVIEKSSKLYWNDFIRLVYSTYPIRTQPRYSNLDLPSLAAKYKAFERSSSHM
ncbi:MAG: DUF4065 domain-containing protein [Blastochloris viridis]|uniref:DUF4065 domain-containing protein n=1 Tax=Blastochloris viridis TaxID=1079 RepID=A0A6N4RAJ8_BLAVI|nr:MAG: DUF4065 domain-containing protein [Blastochloris viridis]